VDLPHMSKRPAAYRNSIQRPQLGDPLGCGGVADHADLRHRLGHGQAWGRIRGGRTPGAQRR
jgi:hypothetical protein